MRRQEHLAPSRDRISLSFPPNRLKKAFYPYRFITVTKARSAQTGELKNPKEYLESMIIPVFRFYRIGKFVSATHFIQCVYLCYVVIVIFTVYKFFKNNVLQFKIHLCNVYVYNVIYIVVESVYTSILTYIYRGKTCVAL